MEINNNKTNYFATKLSNLFDSSLKISETKPLDEVIADVRELFLKLYELNPDRYDECDANKVRDQNEFTVKRFVLWNRLNVEKSVRQLDDAMKWRKENRVNLISDKDAPIEFYRAAAIYSLGSDKTGLPVIYFRAKTVLKIKKLQPIYHLIAIGIINKIDTETNGCGFTCVMDLNEVGLKNADLDLIQYVISVLRNYFPLALNKIIVYNLPWYLKGFVPIIKLWLSEEEQELLKFASNYELFDYIDTENVPKYMGGSNTEDFTLVPEGCKYVEELAEQHGFTRAEAKKYMKKFEQHICEGQQLATNKLCYKNILNDDTNNNNNDGVNGSETRE